MLNMITIINFKLFDFKNTMSVYLVLRYFDYLDVTTAK